MSCANHWKQRISNAAIDGLTADSELAKHLETCRACAAEYESAAAFCVTVRQSLPPRPRQGSLNTWSVIAPRLEKRSAAVPQLRWDFAAVAGLAMLILGIGIGRWAADVPVTDAPTLAGATDSIAGTQDRTTQEYLQFLETATPLLLAVANRSAGPATVSFSGVDAGVERDLAVRLAEQSSALSARLTAARHDREARLVESLEIVFLQLANMPEGQYVGGLELVQATIEERAILFQLTVEEMRRES